MSTKRAIRKSQKVDGSKTNNPLVDDIYTSLNQNLASGFEIIQPFELSQRHLDVLHLMQRSKTKMVLIDGPAGSGKTFLAVYAALMALKERYVDKIIYIRSIAESADNKMGSLPGEIDDKFLPWSMPLIDKVNELTRNGTGEYLFQHGLIKGIPVNFCRGLTFHRTFVIVDESQNFTKKELMVILTRFGNKTKYAVIGDKTQSDIPKSCFNEFIKAFDTPTSRDHDIFVERLTSTDIVRSEILKYIVDVIETIPKT
jgi:phosphate starvation-inducible PhoH-like protein